MDLTAIAINCSLKHTSAETSSTDKMIQLLAGDLAKHQVELTFASSTTTSCLE